MGEQSIKPLVDARNKALERIEWFEAHFELFPVTHRKRAAFGRALSNHLRAENKLLLARLNLNMSPQEREMQREFLEWQMSK